MEEPAGADNATGLNSKDQPKHIIEDEVDKSGWSFEQKLAELKALVENPNFEIDRYVLDVASPGNIDGILANANKVANAQAKAILEKISGSSPAHRHR